MIMVSGSSIASMSRTTWSRKCALTARITRSWGPAAAALSTALTVATCSLPSSQISFRPCSRIAASCAPWSITVTGLPAPASFAAIRPPMAPAPTTQMRMGRVGPSAYLNGTGCTKVLASVPMPSIVISIVFSAARMAPTPTEVPQAMTSPGKSVMSRDSRLTSRCGGKIMSLTG